MLLLDDDAGAEYPLRPDDLEPDDELLRLAVLVVRRVPELPDVRYVRFPIDLLDGARDEPVDLL